MPESPLRQLPSVDELLTHVQDLIVQEGHQRVVGALRAALISAREAIHTGRELPSEDSILAATRQALLREDSMYSMTVINATGVIIHTNLGRAVLSQAAQAAMATVAANYSPLEFDLHSGHRGQRGKNVDHLLCQVTGAEDALVVNNCAAAVVLMLSAIAQNKAVVVSRGQLVEIGGGFRIPEIMEQSGARLVEVGTTNRTRVSDFAHALEDHSDIAAMLRVHQSNFRITGFSQAVGVEDLVELSRGLPKHIPVLDDLGSGAILDTRRYGLVHEPMPQESIEAGASVVTFSGDKLLGGPQAGILVGKREFIELCRSHPLARAFRTDKFTLAALGATALHYLRGEAEREVPIWRMISMTKEQVHRRAMLCIDAMQEWLHRRAITAELTDGESTIGGGSLPGETLPTSLISLQGAAPDVLASALRSARVPIISRIQNDCVTLDLRTVLDDQALLASIQQTE